MGGTGDISGDAGSGGGGGAAATVDCYNGTVWIADDRYDDPGGVPYPDLTQLPGVCLVFVLLYLAVMILSLVGNVMVCFTVLSDRKMHTAVNYYMVNLAACDLAVGGFVLPVKLMELAGPASWSLMTDWLCTALLYSQTVVVFASVLTLVATCLERYLAIVHPLVSRVQQSKARAKRILLVVWAGPCVLAAPFLNPARAESDTLWSEYGSISRRSCLIMLDPRFRRGYYLCLFLLMYLLPLLFIGWTCGRIARCLLRGISLTRQGSLRRQEANRRKVAKMVMVVAAAFAFSWTPYFLVSMVTQFGSNYLEKQNYFFTMLSINLLAFLNSCVNPFIYAAMSSRFRAGFRRILHPGFCRCGSPWIKAPRPGLPTNTSSCRRLPRRLVNGTSLLSSASSGSQSDTVQQTAVHFQQRLQPPSLRPSPPVPVWRGPLLLTNWKQERMARLRRTFSDSMLTGGHSWWPLTEGEKLCPMSKDVHKSAVFLLDQEAVTAKAPGEVN